MDSKSLAEQEKDVRDLLRRAERTPVKTSALRRDTLRRLIDLAHSPHPSLKIIAATNLKLFIRDFPDLEDDAINAVYDLCEDPVAGVRIKGYAAIVDVSREQSKWVKRNADVLVQLLQSDEPEEVTFVKRALTQHLDLDPVVTLGVLCDQVIPSDEPLDEEELAIRDRIRSLVLAFLAGEAKRPLIDRHASCLDSPAEAVLVSGLFKAITKLALSDVTFIIEGIVISLPSFTPYSSRGKELLDILLTQARAALKSDIPSDAGRGSLISSGCYLDLAFSITVERRLAHPSYLLGFYHMILLERQHLSRLSEEEQSNVIRNVARILAACEEIGGRAPPTAPAADLGKTSAGVSGSGDNAFFSKQCSDTCAMLLLTFAGMTSENQRPWEACVTLVQVVARWKRDDRRQTFQAIPLSTLERIGTLHAPQEASVETKAAQEQVHSLIRSLVEPVKPPVPSTVAPATVPQTLSKRSSSAEDAQKAGTGAGVTLKRGDKRSAMNINKRKLDAPNGPVPSSTPSGSSWSRSSTGPTTPKGAHGQPASLPPRPSPATVAASGRGAPKVPRGSPPVPDVATPKLLESSLHAPPSARADRRTLQFAKKDRKNGHEANGDDRRRINPQLVPVPIAKTLNVLGAAATRKAPDVALSIAEDSTAAPSLLSRLAGQPGRGPGVASLTPDRDQLQTEKDRRHGRSNRDPNGEQTKERLKSLTTSVVPAKRPADTSSSGVAAASTTPSLLTSISSRVPSLADSDKDPVIGFSIRGAAKAAHAASTKDSNRGAGSLLERLQASEESGSEWGGRKKKRTKHS